MSDALLFDLTQRVQRLESENSWLKRILVSFGILVLGLGVVGAQRAEIPKVIDAERVVLRDKNNIPRVVLGLDANNAVDLSLNGKDGKSRLSLLVDPEGREAHLEFFDGNIKERLTLGVLPDQSVGGVIVDPDGKPCIMVNAQPNHVEGISLIGKDGKYRMAFGLRNQDSSEMMLYDRQGRKRLSLNVSPTEDGKSVSPSIVFKGDSGASQITIMTHDDGSAGMSFSDPRAKDRLMLGLGPKGTASVGFRNEDGGLGILMNLQKDATPGLEIIDKTGKVIFAPVAKP